MCRYVNEEIILMMFPHGKYRWMKIRILQTEEWQLFSWIHYSNPKHCQCHVWLYHVLQARTFLSCHWCGKWIQLLHFLWNYSSKVHLSQNSVMAMQRGRRSSGDKLQSMWNLKETPHQAVTFLLLSAEIFASYCPWCEMEVQPLDQSKENHITGDKRYSVLKD